jgi:Flp pilus assembly protein TadB
VARGRERRAYAGEAPAATRVSAIAAGALAAALAGSCAVLAPFARIESATVQVGHPDRRALDDANWRRPIWHWESLRGSCILAGAMLSLATPLPLILLVAAGALMPSMVIRSRAAAARSRARLATTHLLRATEAALRSGASLPEALRRACGAASENPLARRPFVDALRAFDLGAPLDQALRASADGATDERSRLALETLAMGIASRLPYDRAGILVAAVADRLAFEERLDEEIRARTAGLRSQVLLLALVVPALAAYLAFTVPSLAATLAQPIGRFVLIPAALSLEIVGVIASRRAIAGALR